MQIDQVMLYVIMTPRIGVEHRIYDTIEDAQAQVAKLKELAAYRGATINVYEVPLKTLVDCEIVWRSHE